LAWLKRGTKHQRQEPEKTSIRHLLEGSMGDLSGELGDTQEILSLLYLIAEDQSKRTGYIHRGVSCNFCGATPIKGARYHCSECADVDLCQSCETAQRHDPMHSLLKIKVPIPVMKSPRWIRKSWRPSACINSRLPLLDKLPDQWLYLTAPGGQFDVYELEALHAQFRTLVDVELANDAIPYGISQNTLQQIIFGKCNNSLVANRVVQVCDRDQDGIISFAEFLGVVSISRTSARVERLAFEMFDLSGTGYANKENAKKVIRSWVDFMKTVIATESDGSFIAKRIEEDALSTARPLSATFLADIIPGTFHPAKDAKLVNAESVVDEVSSRYLSDGNVHVNGRDQALFGLQAARDLNEALDIDVSRTVDRLWEQFPPVVQLTPEFFEQQHIDWSRLSPLYDWVRTCGIQSTR
jgi:Ca2+-binding EF-hand superfamily protein